MKIVSIHITTEDLELTRPYTIAFKTVSSVKNGIITIRSDSGLTGWGAFNPCYEVVGEKLEDATGMLSEAAVGWLIGKDLQDIKGLLEWVQGRFAGSTTARTGLEIAIYDLYTQHLGIPLVEYLGRHLHTLPTSITIGIKNVQETLIEAKEYIERKFRILKIKLGVSLEEDIERLIRIREKFGFSTDIIIDANQGYNKDQFEDFCRRTAHLAIRLIEQPFPVGEEETMGRLPRHIRRLVAADESLLTPADAVLLASSPKACGIFNIKLMKCGGISRALQIAHTATVNAVDLMWGCNDESIISITAALHTAFSCPNTKFIDLDGSLDLAGDKVKGGFILKDGMMSVADRPGLGLIPLD